MPSIYLSYAYVDNQNFEDGQRGWINEFRDDLETRLAFALGKVVPISFFHDRQFGKPNLLTIKYIKETSVFLIIGSPAYFFSDYCQSELGLFLKRNEINPLQQIIFINKIPFDDYAAAAIINEKNFYQFYDLKREEALSRNHHSKKYTKRLDMVAEHIGRILEM